MSAVITRPICYAQSHSYYSCITGLSVCGSPSGNFLEMSYVSVSCYFAILLAGVFVLGRRYSSTAGLRQVPGPFFARLSPLYRVYLFWSGKCNENFAELDRKYSLLVRIGPNHLITCDSSAVNVIYGSGGRFPKSDFYRVFALTCDGRIRDTVFSTRDVGYHKMMQSHMAGRYSPKNMEMSRSSIEHCVDLFVDRMTGTAGQRVDFGSWAKYWAFDTNAMMNFGRPFGFISCGRDLNNIITGNDIGFRIGALIGRVPSFNRIILENKALMRFLSVTIGMSDPTADFVKLIEAKVAQSEARKEPQQCVLTGLRKEQGNPHKKDLDDVCRIIHLSNYLNAVTEEALRLAPTNNIPLERVVPAEGSVIHGYEIPRNTVIGASAYVLHQDRNIYGLDAGEFRPERWLDSDSAVLREMESHFFAFGRGERGCSGRALAMMMMRIFVVRILWAFDVEWAGDKDTWDLKTWWMPEQRDFFLRFKPRADLVISSSVKRDE
ncbi:MAG: hypothetical protein Q9222_002648 [Ikaeria aurantiellina]